MVSRARKMMSVVVMIAMSAVVPAAVSAEPDSKVLVTVGQETITQSDLNARTVMLPPQIRSRFETAAGRAQMLEQVVLVSLLAQEARRLGIDKQEDVAKKIKEAVDNIIVQELTRHQISGEVTVTDEEIAAYYDGNKHEFVRPKQINTSVIMFEAGAQATADVKKEKYQRARETLKRLKKGADFAEVAKEVSEDKRTQRRDGRTGFFAEGRRERIYGKKFEQQAFGLKKGEISDVFETEFGYFIVRLDDIQPRTEEGLSSARSKIERKLHQIKQREAYEQYVESLKEKYPVVYAE
jgi:peptidyl-prolyl cis-trans isomerase C